jgi:uncharacterized protein involved in copper resistance
MVVNFFAFDVFGQDNEPTSNKKKSDKAAHPQSDLKDALIVAEKESKVPAKWFYTTIFEASRNFKYKIYEMALMTRQGPLQIEAQGVLYKGKVSEFEGTLLYFHKIHPHIGIKAGMSYVDIKPLKPYVQPEIGVQCLLPHHIDANIMVSFPKGAAVTGLNIGRENPVIDNKLYISTGIGTVFASKSLETQGIGKGLNYIEFALRPYYKVTHTLNIYAELVRIEYYQTTRDIILNQGGSPRDTYIAVGASLRF